MGEWMEGWKGVTLVKLDAYTSVHKHLNAKHLPTCIHVHACVYHIRTCTQLHKLAPCVRPSEFDNFWLKLCKCEL